MFARIGLATVSLALAVTTWADESDKVATWVGGVSSAWNNPANWAEGVVPGRYITKDADGNTVTNGTRGWTAKFCRKDARWLVEFMNQLYSVSNVVISGENATTRFGSGQYHVLYIEEGGGIYVEEGTKNVPEIQSPVTIGGLSGDGLLHVRNDSDKELVLVNGFNSTCVKLPGGECHGISLFQHRGKRHRAAEP